MNKYRKYTYLALAILLAFILVNAVIWKCWTEKILSTEYNGGDLARMGYLPDSKLLRKNHNDLPLRHIEEHEYHDQSIRVVTIGDSFSNGGGGGKNRYYQDYIASINRCGVLNIESYQLLDNITLTAILSNNGFLDRVRPKYLIVGASEKFCLSLYGKPLDLSVNYDMEKLSTFKRMGYNVSQKSTITFINQGNFKFLFNTILFKYSDHAFFSKTYVRDLIKPLFSVKADNKLLFFREDINIIPVTNEKYVSVVNDNLNKLADILRTKGITLYFMPSVDKYNLYSTFIVDNPYPYSTFFEELRKLPKRYTLIDTKAILLPELEKGERDVFYPDDTHWSWKASKKIFETVRFP